MYVSVFKYTIYLPAHTRTYKYIYFREIKIKEIFNHIRKSFNVLGIVKWTFQSQKEIVYLPRFEILIQITYLKYTSTRNEKLDHVFQQLKPLS